jgi:hypothetical protein
MAYGKRERTKDNRMNEYDYRKKKTEELAINGILYSIGAILVIAFLVSIIR